MADGRSDLQKASVLCEKAFASSDLEERQRLARKALMLCEQCPDAHTLLAESSESPQESRAYYEKALRAAEAIVGPEAIVEADGGLWHVEGGPAYLRARGALGCCLSKLDERRAAGDHLLAVLSLDRADHYCFSHAVIVHLLQDGRDEEASRIISEHPCSCTAHLYSEALACYRLDGACADSRPAMEQALCQDPMVPMFMLGMRQLPIKPSEVSLFGVLLGDDPLDGAEAAVCYTALAGESWRTTPGALEWMEQAMGGVLGQLYEELEDLYGDNSACEERLSVVVGPDLDAKIRHSVQSGKALAWLFVQRQPEAEDKHLASYKQALERLLEEKAVEHELTAGGSRSLGLFEEPTEDKPYLTYSIVIAEVEEIVGLIHDLHNDGVGGFLVCTERQRDEEVFEALGIQTVDRESGPPLDLLPGRPEKHWPGGQPPV